mgnify:CR=1 FL=1
MLVKSKGIVLREVRFEDTNKILTIFSYKYGKINAISKGALRPRSPLLASSQIFSYSDYTFFKGKSFYHVNQGDIIDSFYDIRKDMNRFLYASYLVELVESCIVEEQPNEKLFLLLIKGLSILSKLNSGFLKFSIAFEVKYISFIGYRPCLNRCVLCGNNSMDKIKFSFKNGGIICSNCYDMDKNSYPFDIEMLKYLQLLLFNSLDDLNNLKIPEDMMFKLQSIMVKYILTCLEKTKFKTLEYINGINKNGGV